MLCTAFSITATLATFILLSPHPSHLSHTHQCQYNHYQCISEQCSWVGDTPVVGKLWWDRNIHHTTSGSKFFWRYIFNNKGPYIPFWYYIFCCIHNHATGYITLTNFTLTHTHTHTVLHGYQLCQGEQAVSLTSCTLGESVDTKNIFYVVGTAFVDIGEREPTQGRVLVFQVTDSEYIVQNFTVVQHLLTSFTRIRKIMSILAKIFTHTHVFAIEGVCRCIVEYLPLKILLFLWKFNDPKASRNYCGGVDILSLSFLSNDLNCQLLNDTTDRLSLRVIYIFSFR